ncbi:MAG TPA: hypothetical protein VN653_07260 [Anaerolineales bacterium]|nr:hypothetical protein [Anaerolineales bacterium]
MHTEQQILRVPLDHSVDWRFLLPFSQDETVLFVGDQSNYLKKVFEDMGFPAAAWPSTISLPDVSSLRLSQSTFHIVAMPYGMAADTPLGKTDATSIYGAVRAFLKPGGVLLLGFNNVFRGNDTKIPAASRGQIRKTLRRAGYLAINFYGVYPNVMIPEYIIPLELFPFLFAMDFHLRSRLPGSLLGILSNRLVFTGISNLLPAYFAVAKP